METTQRGVDGPHIWFSMQPPHPTQIWSDIHNCTCKECKMRYDSDYIIHKYRANGISLVHGQKVTKQLFVQTFAVLQNFVTLISSPPSLEATCGHYVGQVVSRRMLYRGPENTVRQFYLSEPMLQRVAELPLPQKIKDKITNKIYLTDMLETSFFWNNFGSFMVKAFPLLLLSHMNHYLMIDEPYPD